MTYSKFMETTKINIVNTIGDSYAVEAEEGQKVYDLIKKAFNNGNKVMLSFLNIEMMTTAFLNTAVGQLYSTFSEEKIRELLQVQEISKSGAISLKRVVDTAKLYYKDPDALKRSIEAILEG